MRYVLVNHVKPRFVLLNDKCELLWWIYKHRYNRFCLTSRLIGRWHLYRVRYNRRCDTYDVGSYYCSLRSFIVKHKLCDYEKAD